MNSPHVIVGTSQWYLSGVNTFSANLVRALRAADTNASFLLTNDPLESPKPEIERPTDIPFDELPLIQFAPWSFRWGKLISYLSTRAPCIYLPNQDRAFSCASPLLPDNVKVVGVAHADEEYHYEHIQRMGDYWNAIVCVSPEVARQASARFPALAPKIVSIPNSVPAPVECPNKIPREEIRLIYAGRLSQYQKRILDLPEIVRELYRIGIKFRLSILGRGKDEHTLKAAMQSVDPDAYVSFRGAVSNDKVIQAFHEHDAFLLTSEFEGLPVALLEAMSRGCIPICSKVASGVTEVVKHKQNGLIFPIGYTAECAKQIGILSADLELRNRLSRSAYETIATGPFSLSAQISAYLDLFEKILHGPEAQSRYSRKRGRPVPAPYFDPTLKGELKRHIQRLMK